MIINYKNITIKSGKTKHPKVYSGEYEIGELHGEDYIAFTDQKELEFSFKDIDELVIAWKMYINKKDCEREK